MKLHGVMIGTEDAAKLSLFYTKILGEPVFTDNGFFGYALGDSMLMLGGHSDIKGSNMSPARMMMHFESEDVKAEFDHIKGLGATVVAEPYNPNPDDQTLWLATFADPDGNYFQLASPWK